MIKPTILKPHVYINTGILDINYEKLNKIGIKYLIFDRDNTLAKHLHTETTQEIMELLNVLKINFQIYIVSNAKIEQDYQFGLKVLKTQLKKPHNFAEIQQKIGNLKPEEICIIGDRLLTDVALANLNGCVSVLCKPIDESMEDFAIKMMRKVEQLYLNQFQKKWEIHQVYGDLNQ